ncbi:MAG: ParB/RepB/Spo0J family partition protein [Xanthobacteraceae bacterium]|nr:ParB/RepB/Spo0J family partition protein [Xanthobacteraceae bacterium]
MTYAIQEIPLSKLIASSANVRRTGRSTNIGELAASIEAHGLLQNLTVRPVLNGKKKPEAFEVIAGGRRLAALKTLAKRKALPVNANILCNVITEGISEEISLAENALQCPMHPADQYEAFAKLHDEHGMSAEDIAARFGVTPAVVKQRLKLGAVSPKLMKLYRSGELNLDQLTAFAITDDHAKQERVWSELPSFNRDREAILHALSEGQVRSDDRRAVFVGAKTYEAAGGVIVRDLFDAEGGGFLADAELLNRLAREKLQAFADAVSAEGWKWVVVEPEFDHGMTAEMRRIYPEAVKLSKDERKQLRKLQSRYDALCEKYADAEMPEKIAAQCERLERAIEALDRHEFKGADFAIAGAIVTLSHDGEVRVEHGLVRREDEPSKNGEANKKKGSDEPSGDEKAPLSERLVADLTAHRTAGLRNELAQNSGMAVIATVHALAAASFFSGGGDVSCLQITPRSGSLATHASGIEESLASRQIAERHEAWAKRLPREPATLWNFVHGLSDSERLGLLAHCVSLTVNAVQASTHRSTEASDHADILARELALDMTAYWQPTAESYFGRVAKERILEAVHEGVTEAAATNIAAMKKQPMAETAEKLLAGKGWLPTLLRLGANASA